METKVEEALLKAVSKINANKTGIAFSGGIDSTLLALACRKLGRKFTLYTVGLQGSADIEWATKVAVKMEFPLKIKIVNKQEAVETIHNIANLLRTDDPIHVGVGCMTHTVEKFAKDSNENIVLFGLGADEAFAGYGSHMKALEKNEVHEECQRRLAGVTKDIERDSKISEAVGIKAALPFLDEELVETAMQVKPEHKISKGQKKIILRKIAINMGLPEELAERPKKAAQYGSGFDKAIERLAKLNGYETKKDYLASLLSDELEP